jgi:hypothetical protein
VCQQHPWNLDELLPPRSYPFTVVWDIDVSGIPHSQGLPIYGLTDNCRNRSAAGRFVRFRLPFVCFEWHFNTPYSLLEKLRGGDVEVKVNFAWTAWATGKMASGVW